MENKIINYIIKISFIILIISCDHPAEFIRNNINDPHGIYFGILISKPITDESISGIYPITIEAEFLSTPFNLERLYLYINDSLLTTGTEIPFSYALKSNNLDYGFYNIKCLAYSKDGRIVEESVEVFHGKDSQLGISLESNELTLLWDYGIVFSGSDLPFKEHQYEQFKTYNYNN